ncbi:MAG: 5-nucleotidase [Gammaproteobacteria bacterium]|jgi:putative hydrolase of the HAD superfamily|nr:5-nucleotidase [Gammaproteobacteria bacterium]
MHNPEVDWSKIDTVLLDMDGTLLDLRFDNWFWQELIPSRYAAANDLSPSEARDLLKPKFHAIRGTMQWYCIEHWTRELGLDIAVIKRERTARRQVGYLPGALDFLLRLKQSGKRRMLVTNSHPTTLAIKNEQVGITAHFDACYSTHRFDVPKEHPAFWPRFQAVEPFIAERTLFVDDSLSVLDAAHHFGIGWLRAVRRPDSGQPAQNTGHYAAVDRVAELLS